MVLFVVIVLSLALAAASVVAWRMARAERRRSEARVARLGAAIRAADPAIEFTAGAGAAAVTGGMFAVAGDPARETSAPLLQRGVLVLCAVAVVGFVVLASRGPRATRGATDRAPAQAQAETPATLPLELVSLDHESDAAGFTLRGVVRNPPAGARLDHLAAVVLLFGPDGAFISTGRADVATGGLPGGAEAAFAVTVAHAERIARYRVSFRTGDRIVPHIDRRT